ncbi:TIGR03086 family metal-binding protein [Streptomyces sp. NBC_00370]|uniref:TIGR03086 family metal-binding protein n=1 Tax=Streptomyces sp. NBC_00370 TaxID=2975728 RepID=UPI002E259757
MPDLIELDRRAVERSAEIVDGVDIASLERPTPCAGWTLRDLLGHMTAHQHGFAAAADGAVSDRADWAAAAVGPEPSWEYRTAAERVTAAFAADGVLDRPFWLPEVRDGGPFPGRVAVGFHLVDYVAHGWDVAATLGVEASYAPDVVEAALSIARKVPTGADRLRPDASFAPVRPHEADASPMDRMLSLLGRDPAWRAEVPHS